MSDKRVGRLKLFSIAAHGQVLDALVGIPESASLRLSSWRLTRLEGYLHGHKWIQQGTRADRSEEQAYVFSIFDLSKYLDGSESLMAGWDPTIALPAILPVRCTSRKGMFAPSVDSSDVIVTGNRLLFDGSGTNWEEYKLFSCDIAAEAIDSKGGIDLLPWKFFSFANEKHVDTGSACAAGSYFAASGPSPANSAVQGCHIFDIETFSHRVCISPATEVRFLDSTKLVIVSRPAVLLIDLAAPVIQAPPKSVGLWVGIFGAYRPAAPEAAKPPSSVRPFALVELDLQILNESIVGIFKTQDWCALQIAGMSGMSFLLLSIQTNFFLDRQREVRIAVGHSTSPKQPEYPPLGCLTLPPAVRSVTGADVSLAEQKEVKVQRFPLNGPSPKLAGVEYILLGLNSSFIVDFDPRLFASASKHLHH